MRITPVLFVALMLIGACAQKSPLEKIDVEAKDYSFTPSVLGMPAGKRTFAVHNTGNKTHEFEIFRGKKLIGEVEDIAPGLTRNLTATLERGRYRFICDVDDHLKRGMKGTLTVR